MTRSNFLVENGRKLVEMVEKSEKKEFFVRKKAMFFVFDVYYPFYYPGSKRITNIRITDSEFAPGYPGPPDIRGLSGASLVECKVCPFSSYIV